MKISVIIPALNEEKTVGKIVGESKKAKGVKEVLVVDACSTDRTAEVARRAGAKVVRQDGSLPKGKGTTMQAGVEKAGGDVLVFIDGDIKNFKKEVVEKLTSPVVEGDADFVKGAFVREAGRVTEITAKPLMKTFFPELEFSQPLSGQIAGKREFFKKIKFEINWGVDVGILLDAARAGARMKEVDIGYVEHRMKPVAKLSKMSQEVAGTIMNRALNGGRLFFGIIKRFFYSVKRTLFFGAAGEKEKVAFFDMDGTLLNGRFIDYLARRHGFQKELSEIRVKFKQEKILESEASNRIAMFLKGMSEREIKETASQIPLNKGVETTIDGLRKRGFKIAILSDSYDLVADAVRRRVSADYAIAKKLEVKNGRSRGRVISSGLECGEECGHSFCKLAAVNSFAKSFNVDLRKSMVIGDSMSDAHAMQAVGIRVAFKAPDEVKESANIIIDNMEELLAYI